MKKIIIPLLFAMLCAVSCINIREEYPEGKVRMEFYAATTRTSLSSANAVLWSANDTLSVFGTADTDNNPFVLTSGSGTASAMFGGTIAAGSSQYWAVYPYNTATSFDSSTSTLTVTLPQTQAYSADGFATATNYMAATSSTPALPFKNLCGLLKFSLTGNTTIDRIVIIDSSGQPLSGTATVIFDSNGTPALTMTESNSLPVIIDCGEGVTLSAAATTFYAVVPPRTFSDGLQIIVTDTSDNAMIHNVAATSVSRAGIRNLGNIDYTLETVVYYGTANCYNRAKSESAQTVQIDITPYGTSESSLYTANAAGSAYQATDATVLWQDTSGLVASAVVSGTTLSVDIAANTAGNALVAILNSSGTILWSFHVWITDSVPSLQTFTGDYSLMDRNLGATSTGDDGFYYQWGRKDPFRTSGYTTTAGTVTVAYTVENPTVFVTSSSVSIGWYVEDYVSLWGNPFGYTALPTILQGTKTIYDPCPEGYQVATPGVYNILSSSNFAWSSSARVATVGGVSVAYPAAGFITVSGTLASQGTSGVYWTNAPYDFYEHVNQIYHLGGATLYFTQSDLAPLDWHNAAAAAPMRCMRTNR